MLLVRPTWKRLRTEQRWKHGNDDTVNNDGNCDIDDTVDNDGKCDIDDTVDNDGKVDNDGNDDTVQSDGNVDRMMLQVGETKILELEEELRVVANNLKSLEVFIVIFGRIFLWLRYNDHVHEL